MQDPPIIRAKIWDVAEAQRFSGYHPKLNALPCDLLNVLSGLFGLPLNIYRQTIVTWMEEHLKEDQVAENWWATRGQDWAYYKTVLEAGCIPNGLEVWAACQASGVHLNLIQHGQVWSSCASGIDHDDFTIMILEESTVTGSRQTLGLL